MCYTLGNTWSSRVNAIVLGAPRHSLDELANEAFGEFLSKVCYPSLKSGSPSKQASGA